MMKSIIIMSLLVYFAICGYIITAGMQSARISSFKLGCASVADAPTYAIRQCESMAEDGLK